MGLYQVTIWTPGKLIAYPELIKANTPSEATKAVRWALKDKNDIRYMMKMTATDTTVDDCGCADPCVCHAK